MYTYKYIIIYIYILKSRLILISFFKNTLFCLSFAHSLVKAKLGFEFELFAK